MDLKPLGRYQTTEDIMSGEQQHGCVTLRGGVADLLSALIIHCLARHGVR